MNNTEIKFLLKQCKNDHMGYITLINDYWHYKVSKNRIPDENDLMSGKYYHHKFSNWSDFLIEMEGKAEKIYQMENARKFIRKIQQSPKLMKERLIMHPQPYQEYKTGLELFGDWDVCLEICGLKKKFLRIDAVQQHRYLVKLFRGYLLIDGMTPKTGRNPKLLRLLKMAGGWNRFLHSEGLPNALNGRENLPDQPLFDELKILSDQLGYAPTSEQFYRSPTLVNHFGSWKNVLKAAGLKATYIGNQDRKFTVTVERIQFWYGFIQEVFKQNNIKRKISYEFYVSIGPGQAMLNVYGSWEKFVRSQE